MAETVCPPGQSPFNFCSERPPKKPPVDKPPVDRPPVVQPQPACTETAGYSSALAGRGQDHYSTARADMTRADLRRGGASLRGQLQRLRPCRGELPLFGATTYIAWKNAAGTEQKIDVPFEQYGRTVQIELLLGRSGRPRSQAGRAKGVVPSDNTGNIYAGKPNTDLTNGYGVLARADDGTAGGRTPGDIRASSRTAIPC